MFLGFPKLTSTAPPVIKNITYVSFGRCLLDEMQISDNPSANEFQEWNRDTVMHAKFNGDLTAGNVNYLADEIDYIRVKYKQSQEFKWHNLYEQKITKAQDMSFKCMFPYARGNMDYDFSLTPVFSGDIEGNINKNTIRSEFDGLYILEADKGFQAFLNLDISHNNNRESVVQSTIGSKYPYVITNGDSNYVSGNISATFIQKINNRYDTVNGWKYRMAVNDFLMDGHPKLIKNSDGQMWLAMIVGNPDEDYSQHQEMPVHKINFVEIGDCDSEEDLVNNGLLDIDVLLE